MAEPEFSDSDYAAVARRMDVLVPHDLAWKSSVAILIERGASLHVHGTGTLVRIEEESFLVTARHVIERATGQNLLITGSNSEIVPLVGEAILSDVEQFDVAAIPLTSSVTDRLQDATFLRLDHMLFEMKQMVGLYAIFGFPEIMAFYEKGSLTITRFHLVTPLFDGEAGGLENHHPKYHLLLGAKLEEVKSIDGKPMTFRYREGVSAQFPKELTGISGCSVWKIAETPADLRRKDSEGARLVAVETGVYKECIKATRWKAVTSMIGEAMPALRPVIDMWRPS